MRMDIDLAIWLAEQKAKRRSTYAAYLREFGRTMEKLQNIKAGTEYFWPEWRPFYENSDEVLGPIGQCGILGGMGSIPNRPGRSEGDHEPGCGRSPSGPDSDGPDLGDEPHRSGNQEP